MSNLIFGIYPGGMSGSATGMTSGPPNNPGKISSALSSLTGSSPMFLVRAYSGYKGPGTVPEILPENPGQYIAGNRALDLVLCFQYNDEELSGWKDFIRQNLKEFNNKIRYLQITEEANVDLPNLDGHFPAARKALVEGIVFAKRLIKELRLTIEVGFNATPDFNPDRRFWKEIRSLATPDFYESVDYVGLDFFPDVFRPLPRVHGVINAYDPIKQVISVFKNDIVDAGIRHDIPLHISENGWPTSEGRSEKEQALALESIIRSVHQLRSEFNIKTYEMFDLRDADSSIDDIFYRFGLMRDDYTPKIVFDTYRSLISELTERQ